MRDFNFSDKTLNQYFYSKLDQLNKKVICPLPQEFVYYSAITLEDYAHSQKFFQPDKGLGYTFVEAQQKTDEERKKIYKDVGDSILVQMGLFPEYLKGKLLNKSYFINIGKMAYNHMEHLECTFYDIPNFYKLFSSSFENIVNLLELYGESNKFENYDEYLINKPSTNKVAS